MSNPFKKIASFFHKHPGIKTTAAGLGGAAVTAAANGMFGPKAAAVAAGIGAIIGLFTKRPQDGAGVPPAEEQKVVG